MTEVNFLWNCKYYVGYFGNCLKYIDNVLGNFPITEYTSISFYLVAMLYSMV